MNPLLPALIIVFCFWIASVVILLRIVNSAKKHDDGLNELIEKQRRFWENRE